MDNSWFPGFLIVRVLVARGATGWETFPKTAIYCHLLPFSRRKTATTVTTVLFFTCPSRACRPAWAPG